MFQNGSWMAIWDAALEHGSKGTRYTQALLRAFSQPVFGDRKKKPVLIAIAESLKMSQLWNTSATVTVSLLMLIPSLMLSLTNITAYLHMVNSFFISSICNYKLSIYFLYNTNQCCFVRLFFILQVHVS